MYAVYAMDFATMMFLELCFLHELFKYKQFVHLVLQGNITSVYDG